MWLSFSSQEFGIEQPNVANEPRKALTIAPTITRVGSNCVLGGASISTTACFPRPSCEPDQKRSEATTPRRSCPSSGDRVIPR